MTATIAADQTLSLLDFALPCESQDEGGPCPYEANAEWVVKANPPCGHLASILICDYCRLDFQQWCLDVARDKHVKFACGVCQQRIDVPIFDVYRLYPLRAQ